MNSHLAQANALRLPLPDRSVHLVFTSVPYLWKRDYGVMPTFWHGRADCCHSWTAVKPPVKSETYSLQCDLCGMWYGCLGLEPTPELFVKNLVTIFREAKRVLHPSGSLVVNIDDTRDPKERQWMGVPHMLALALKADGWRWEDKGIWWVTNRMPNGGVRSRFTHTFEETMTFNLNRDAYFDIEATRTPLADKTYATIGTSRGNKPNDATGKVKAANWADSMGEHKARVDRDGRIVGAALRNVFPIGNVPNNSSHTASFPPALVRPFIKSATSEKGVCPSCGNPWVRIVKKIDGGLVDRNYRSPHNDGFSGTNGLNHSTLSRAVVYETNRWEPTCDCPNNEPVPALVVDIFAGTAVTVQVAIEEGRRGLGFDLSHDYLSGDAANRLAGLNVAAFESGSGIDGRETDATELPLWRFLVGE